jgi:RNA polymerase-interacting CarD/CdnL/TRCF family regulator
MDFKVGSKVFYPTHGAGWIKDKKEIEFNGEKKMYFEFDFITSRITVSTPIDNLEMLNVRPVLSTKELKEHISKIKKTPTINPKTTDFNKLMDIFKKLEEEANIESTIETIQICNHVKKQREKDGRLIPVSIENELGRAISDVVGELAVSSGTKLETAAKTFEKITGQETKLSDF